MSCVIMYRVKSSREIKIYSKDGDAVIFADRATANSMITKDLNDVRDWYD